MRNEQVNSAKEKEKERKIDKERMREKERKSMVSNCNRFGFGS